jgi:hypothetical protein
LKKNRGKNLSKNKIYLNPWMLGKDY